MVKLSVVVSVYNGEKKLRNCLQSASFADEIIVVNSGSTDKTVQIAKSFTSHIYTRDNNPMLNVNKNFGFEKASGEWILSLDADERIEKDLKKEIMTILSQDHLTNESVTAYKIPRKNYIFGKWIQHTTWYPDYQLRLFKKGYGRFEEKKIHEQIQIKGEIGILKGHIHHSNYETIEQFIDKLNRYTTYDSERYVAEGNQYLPEDIIRYPKDEFIRRYFKGRGDLDGFHGISLSLLQSFSQVVLLLKIWQARGFKDLPLSKKTVEKELDAFYQECRYWFTIENKNGLRNTLKKLLFQMYNKL